MAAKLKIKNIIWFIAISLMAGCATSTGNTKSSSLKEDTAKKLTEEQLKLKNDAFCACLAKTSPEMEEAFTKDGSAAGYLETSSYSIDAFTTVFEAAGHWAAKDYPSKNSKTLGAMKCLDFYNSQELEELINSLDNELIE
ncbi:hypothetical protein RCC89_13535 [Cytophagaceae bacterium ABcell3]|nr:hypothetical protein RCC89_13535 [Cytophagaceae bacterium ABcell3]